MSRKTIGEILAELYERYHHASRRVKSRILTEFCAITHWHRKAAIRKLNGPPPERVTGNPPPPRRRGVTYPARVINILAQVWTAADYPCGVRLQALLPLWAPWIRQRFPLPLEDERLLLSISPRQIDRRLRANKRALKKRRYGRTKPGTLLKHHFPIKTDHWDVTAPGWTEVDTVAHCGNSAEGLYAYTVNQTDILTTWVESRAILGKGEAAVLSAFEAMEAACPFPIKGRDSDNGSEFINWHLLRDAQRKGIQPWRSRPYKKDDQAHVEQKNWTHVRKLFGWDRYDTPAAVVAMNTLYAKEWSAFMNVFVPSMKLVKKERVGSKLRRRYDTPQTPLDRVIASGQGDPAQVAQYTALRQPLDPFTLSATIDRRVREIASLAREHVRHPAPSRTTPPFTPAETATLREVARCVEAVR